MISKFSSVLLLVIILFGAAGEVMAIGDDGFYDVVSANPAVSITSAEGDPTNSSPFNVTVTFDEDVSGFVVGDITVGNGIVSSFVNTVANRTWTADIAPAGQGTVTVDVNAGVATDAGGNGNDAASQFSLTYDSDNPGVSITSGASDPTNSSSFSVTIAFDEDVSGFVEGDITVGNGSTGNFVNTVANRTWAADITPSGQGAVTVDVNAGAATDAAGNGSDAASQFSLTYDSDNPGVSITSGASDPTSNSPFGVTITFDEAVSGFVVGDISVGNGTAGNFVNTVANTTWAADITPSADGAVTVVINSSVATDSAGNDNDAAVQYSLTYDASGPVFSNVPADINVDTDVGLDTATVSWTAPTANDIVDGALIPVQTAGLASGSSFPAGSTTITYSATDALGNSSSVSFAVIVSWLDVDNDTIPDFWEVANGLSTSVDNSATDSDGDGLLDIDEYAADTDPLSADSDGDGLSDNLEVLSVGLDPLIDNATLPDSDGDGLPDSYESAVGLDPLIGNTPTADNDNDGYSDRHEYLLGLNPLIDNSSDLDSDGDGLSDNIETMSGLDPNDPSDALADPDGDGVVSMIELANGTSPVIDNALLADTDNDTIPDLTEWLAGLNPLVANTPPADNDSDGLSDLLEYRYGTLATPNASVVHNDADGLPDIWEICLGTDPYLADSDGDTSPDGIDIFPLDDTKICTGDIDKNGTVEVVDAMLALRLSVGLDAMQADSLLYGDVAPMLGGLPNPDVQINAADAMMILRKALGLMDW